MNYETMHATDLLKALEGRSFCAVAEELAHAEGAYDVDIARYGTGRLCFWLT